MDDFDEDPLDLLDDDNDGVVETALFFDEDSKDKQTESKPPSNSGCCVVFLALGTSIGVAAWTITQFFA